MVDESSLRVRDLLTDGGLVVVLLLAFLGGFSNRTASPACWRGWSRRSASRRRGSDW